MMQTAMFILFGVSVFSVGFLLGVVSTESRRKTLRAVSDWLQIARQNAVAKSQETDDSVEKSVWAIRATALDYASNQIASGRWEA